MAAVRIRNEPGFVLRNYCLRNEHHLLRGPPFVGTPAHFLMVRGIQAIVPLLGIGCCSETTSRQVRVLSCGLRQFREKRTQRPNRHDATDRNRYAGSAVWDGFYAIEMVQLLNVGWCRQ